jgi:hypothetical protein
MRSRNVTLKVVRKVYFEKPAVSERKNERKNELGK